MVSEYASSSSSTRDEPFAVVEPAGFQDVLQESVDLRVDSAIIVVRAQARGRRKKQRAGCGHVEVHRLAHDIQNCCS